jgi:hypothetical protein
LTSALVGDEWSASRLDSFTTDTHLIGGRVGTRTGLDDVEKRKIVLVPKLDFRPFGHPARSQSLYRLRYLGKNII